MPSKMRSAQLVWRFKAEFRHQDNQLYYLDIFVVDRCSAILEDTDWLVRLVRDVKEYHTQRRNSLQTFIPFKYGLHLNSNHTLDASIEHRFPSNAIHSYGERLNPHQHSGVMAPLSNRQVVTPESLVPPYHSH